MAFFSTTSSKKPAATAAKSFAARSFASAPHCPGMATKTGTASSDVAMNTAISVPSVMTLEP